MSTTCTYHCSACGCHFHSLDSFDAHRQGDYESTDPEIGRRCIHPFDLLDRNGKSRLEELTVDGECRMYAEIRAGIAIWTDRKALGRMRAAHALTASSPSSPGHQNPTKSAKLVA
jgi:hypothetical protein